MMMNKTLTARLIFDQFVNKGEAKVIPKVKQIISRLRILCCNSLTHFKLQVVDIMTFQTKALY